MAGRPAGSQRERPARPHFKTEPVIGDRTTEHPQLCLINNAMFIEPPVIISGMVLKNTA